MRHIQYMLSIGAGLRAMLVGLVMAMLLITPAAHADAFGSGSRGTPAADLEARIKALEGLLESLNNKLSQTPQAGTASGGTSSSPEAPASSVPTADFVYEPSYEVGGTVNGYVVIRRNGKMQMLTTREYIVFRSQDKARAYKQFLLEQAGLFTSEATESGNNGNGNGNGGGNSGNGSGNNGNGNGNGPGGGGNGNGNNGNGNGNGSGSGNSGNGNGNNGNGNGNGATLPPPPPPPTPTDGGSGDGRSAALAKKK